MSKHTIKNKGKVAIAMSGGVDSSVTAAMLKKQGYDCIGIFMKLWTEKKTGYKQAYIDAKKVANKLGFPLYTLDLQKPFKKIVVDEWLKEYKNGQTPNPCIRCNKFIKFDLLLQKAKSLGCDYLATGHYVKIRKQRTESREQKAEILSLISVFCSLKMANDKNKDQSYFLYNLTQGQLKNLLFPLGDYTKAQVKTIAKKLKLPVYKKPESQEICFIAEKTHYPFLKRHLKLKSGLIKTLGGKILGQHHGLPLYTLGQREGIGIGGIGPFYVVKLDHKSNTLFVSKNRDDKLLFTKKFEIKNVSWISGQAPKISEKIGVKIRYQTKTIPCIIKKNIVTLKTSKRAIMPGQSAVFYQGQKVLGGGIIKK